MTPCLSTLQDLVLGYCGVTYRSSVFEEFDLGDDSLCSTSLLVYSAVDGNYDFVGVGIVF